VTDFIENDLLKIVENAFGQVDDSHKATLKAEYEQAIQTAKDFGAPDPENTPKVMESKAKYEAVKNTANAEADVYDHLYRFFERYYDNGDFISRRYYTRETSGKAAPFAVPYNGEEVKLHWANADQYYIKTAEYFTNFTFDLSVAAKNQIEKNQKQKDADTKLLFDKYDIPEALKVHFRIIEATEGEHGNVKVGEATKRFFIIHKEKPVELTDDGELIVNFEYRPDPEKGSKQEGSWKQHRNAEAVETILNVLDGMEGVDEYKQLLTVPAPTGSGKKKDAPRPLLAKYVNQYTARNTMDYFIHKDLGGFLRRELDFYIKNEVMRLDDIENADVPAVETYLAKIKVLRRIAGKLIDFLAQLEDFQKKLWLKKKFVVETNYCITLDRVPEELYPEIAVNEAQIEEWLKLFAIDEIEADLHNSGYSRPLTPEFLNANNKLVLDTRFFDEAFKARLLVSVENFDDQCDGLLIHSENFQALNLLQERYREQVKCIYIDPPYNTGQDGFAYKDSYIHSSWLSLLFDRIINSLDLMSFDGLNLLSIDDIELRHAFMLMNTIYGEDNFIDNIIWKKRYGGGAKEKYLVSLHEYVLCFAKSKANLPNMYIPLSEESIGRYYKQKDENFEKLGPYRTHPLEATKSMGARPNLIYEIPAPDGTMVSPKRQWLWSKERTFDALKKGIIEFIKTSDGWTVHTKQYLNQENGEQRQGKAFSIIDDV
jgi:adenine-specific DNA-methyltransferase